MNNGKRLLLRFALLLAWGATGMLEVSAAQTAAVGGRELQDGEFNAPRTPLGFRNDGAFDDFAGNLNSGLRKAGFNDVQPIFQGSSVTGKSFRTGQPFNVGWLLSSLGLQCRCIGLASCGFESIG